MASTLLCIFLLACMEIVMDGNCDLESTTVEVVICDCCGYCGSCITVLMIAAAIVVAIISLGCIDSRRSIVKVILIFAPTKSQSHINLYERIHSQIGHV